MTGKRRGAVLVGGGVVLITLVGVAGAARSETTFSALAAADGVRTTISDPGVVPTGATLGLSGPTAQAVIDSLGNSRAFASLPYPGDLAVSAPGLARGQGAAGVPDYPAYAASNSQGQPSSDVTTPAGYALHAKSDTSSSSATATGGGASDAANAGSSVSSATVATKGGVVTATAESTTEAFEIAGVLRIGRVHALATATGDGKRSSELQFGDVTVAGQAVGITDQGLTTPGGAAPLPDSSPVRAVLAQAGISVRYLAPQTVDDGIESGGVEVHVVRGDRSGTAETIYTIGRAEAVAAGHLDADLPSSTPLPDGSSGTASAPPLEPSVAVATPPAPAPAAALPATRTAAPARAAYRGAPVQSFSAAAIYLVLFLAAGTCLGGVQLIRYLGVKLAWK